MLATVVLPISTTRAAHNIFVQIVFQESRPVAGPGLLAPHDRFREPVTVGIPIPAAAELRDPGKLVLVGNDEQQLRVLSRWPDGSIRWLLVRTRVHVPAGQAVARTYLTHGTPAVERRAPLFGERRESLEVNTGITRFRWLRSGPTLLAGVEVRRQPALGGRGLGLRILGGDGGELRPAPDSTWRALATETGPLYAEIITSRPYRDATGGRFEVHVRFALWRGRDEVKIFVDVVRPLEATAPLAIRAVQLILDTPLVEADFEHGHGIRKDAGIIDDESVFSHLPASDWAAEGVLLHHVGLRTAAGQLVACVGSPALGGTTLRVDASGELALGLIDLPVAAAHSLPPGGSLRGRALLDFGHGPADAVAVATRFLCPVVGKAVSVEIYNDADVISGKLLRGPAHLTETLKLADGSAGVRLSGWLAREFLRIDDASAFVHLRAGQQQVWRALATLPADTAIARISEDLGLWYFLTGDATLMLPVHVRARPLLADLEQRGETRHGFATLTDLTEITALGLDGSAVTLASQGLEAWLYPSDGDGDGGAFDRGRGFVATEQDSQGRSVLTSRVAQVHWTVGQLLRSRWIRGLAQDRLMDVLEGTALFAYRELWLPSGRWRTQLLLDDVEGSPLTGPVPRGAWWLAAAGYPLTGDPALMERCAEALGATGDVASASTLGLQSLRHLVEHTDRYRVWRELTLDVERGVGDHGAVRLSWRVPPRAEAIRIKHADLPIHCGAGSPDPGAISFFGATNLVGEPGPAPTGARQFHDVTGIDPTTTYFAARYLQRGTAVPSPIGTTKAPSGKRPAARFEFIEELEQLPELLARPQPRLSDSPPRWLLLSAGLLAVAGALAIVGVRKRRRAKPW